MKTTSTVCVTWVVLLCVGPAMATEIYVDASATSGGDGTSSAPYTDLQDALATAVSGDTIHVAAGTYLPGDTQNATFQIPAGVTLQGAGEDVTILSGDIGTIVDNTDNVYHVVTVTGAGSRVTLQGFTITGGYAENSSGGGMHVFASIVDLYDIIFNGNYAISGGGMSVGASSIAHLVNVTFAGNSANWGAGMAISPGGEAGLTNVTFSGNAATSEGGGMYACGDGDSFAFAGLTCVTFTGNSAQHGGGMYMTGVDGGYSSALLANVTFSGNTATYHGGGIAVETSSNVAIHHTILWGDTPNEIITSSGVIVHIADSVVQGGWAGGTTITDDPLLGTLGHYGGCTQTIPLQPGSSAIDAIIITDYAPSIDQRGVARPLDGDGNGSCYLDIGAYEYDGGGGGNTPPVANDGTYSTAQDTPVAIELTGSDADDDTLTFAVTAGPSHGTLSGTAPNLTYTPADSYTGFDSFSFVANDGTVASDPATASITITSVNTPPVIGTIITDPINPMPVSTEILAGANFTDSDTGDSHTAEWDWGDWSSSPGDVDVGNNGNPVVYGNHTCLAVGVYTVGLTITDRGGEGDSDTVEYQFVVVYDPAGGFVTGGGWIDSPAGAYVPDPGLSGRASFGFVSKYKKGATVPTGNTEFQFKAGDLNFHSTNYD